jgi:hypothetical protein
MPTLLKRKQAASRDGMIVSTFAVTAEMHRRLRQAALTTNTAATEIVRQAITEWLARHARRRRGSR